jgi:hypothetical protein
MEAIEYRVLPCPYCGEAIELAVDTSVGTQGYVEDCSVCCRPIEVRVTMDADGWSVTGHRDDD